MKSLLGLRGAPSLEKKLRATVRGRLRERRKAAPDLPERWKAELLVRPPGMGRWDALRFAVWHRQFAVRPIPGLGRAVGGARRLVRNLTRWLES